MWRPCVRRRTGWICAELLFTLHNVDQFDLIGEATAADNWIVP
jgi:hypothetical protein